MKNRKTKNSKPFKRYCVVPGRNPRNPVQRFLVLRRGEVIAYFASERDANHLVSILYWSEVILEEPDSELFLASLTDLYCKTKKVNTMPQD